MNRTVLALFVVLIFALNVLSTLFVFFQTERAISAVTANAQNHAFVDLCLNQRPALQVPCSPNMSQDAPYLCQLNYSDPDGDSLSFAQQPAYPDNSSDPLFDISATGLINFTPRNADRGNHSTLIVLSDGSPCDNSFDQRNFSFSVANINDPPYLIRAIPDQSFGVNGTLFAFYLNDYFADPDDDPLAYSVLRDTSEIGFNVSIGGDSRVLITSSECGKAHLKFIANDPFNLSVESNAIQIEVECPEPVDEGTQSSSGGSGGGGGSGGTVPRCEPEMVCLPWSECYPNGLQVQVCRDKNGCSDDEARFYQNCTYIEERPLCEENWLCSDWTVCSAAGMQNRTCSDLSECGSARFRPALEQQCVYIPTCSDTVQNGDETGVDCGGSCPACKTVQQPGLFPENRWRPSLLMLLLIFLLSAMLALFVLYRERIYEGLAELGWALSPRRKKTVLLSPVEKRLLFEEIAALESDLPSLEPRAAYDRLAASVRKFYSLALDLPFEYRPDEFTPALEAAQIPADARAMLAGFAGRLELVEGGKLPAEKLNELLFASVREELRLLVCLFSDYSLQEVAREIATQEIDERLTFAEEIRLRLLSAREALQFQRVEYAKGEYLKIMRAYEELRQDDKAVFYPDIHRLYLQITYAQETGE